MFHVNINLSWLRLAALALLCVSSAEVRGQEREERVRVGLALGGGSARGFAHLGVLRWLEDHRVPVDAIAGTSMGAFIGGAYATGLSAAELQARLANTDWDPVIYPDLPYPSKTFRRKEDDRDRPVKLELGWRGGLRLQSGLNSGHRMGLLLSRISLPYSTVDSFDELPIPFRAVATDLEAGETVVLDRGPLGSALRASMSLPGTFDPVLRDGRRLADGGILNNLPVDVARTMGVDVVIAVSVNASRRVQPAESIQGVANRSIRLMMQSLDRPQLLAADVVILPDVTGIRAADFERLVEIAERGYAAAAGQAASLLQYALDAKAWARYQEDKRGRPRPRTGALSFVEVTGASEGASARIARSLGQVSDPDSIEEGLDRIVGEGRYESAMYRRLVRDGADGLALDFKEKSYAPPLVKLALNAGNENRDPTLSLASRITFLDAPRSGSEARLDLSIGSRLAADAEFLQPLHRGRESGGFFVAPRLYYSKTAEPFYVDLKLVADLTRQRGGGGLDGVWLPARRTELRLGYGAARVSDASRVGPPLSLREGVENEAHLQIQHEGQDRAYLPTRGLRFGTKATWWTKAPGNAGSFGLAEARLDLAKSLTPRQVVMLHVEGATDFSGRAPLLYQPTLGGPFRLGAVPTNAIRGRALLLAGLGHRLELTRLPRLFGGELYGVGLVEVGSAFDRLASAEFKISVTAGFSADTFLGPFFVGVSAGDGGPVRAYFLVGASVR